MSGVRRPIRVRVVWSKDLQPSAGFGDAVQLIYKTKHIRNMLDDVVTDDLFKFIVNLDQRFPSMRFTRKFWEFYLSTIFRGKELIFEFQVIK